MLRSRPSRVASRLASPLASLSVATALLSGGCVGSTVDPGHRGLLNYPLSSGLQPRVYGDGFHWHSPFADMITFDVTWSTSTEDVHTVTAEGLHLEVHVAVRYRPIPNELYGLVTDVGTNYYDEVLGPEFFTAVRGEFAKYKYLDLTTRNEQLENEIEDELRERLKGKHLEIDSVTIEHIDYPQAIADAVEQKLVVSQKAEQEARELDLEQKEELVKQAEAQGEAQAALIKARSDADVAKVAAEAAAEREREQAQADADAQKIRAEGQAEANRALAASLTTGVLQNRALEVLASLGQSGARFVLFPGEWHKLPELLMGNAGE